MQAQYATEGAILVEGGMAVYIMLSGVVRYRVGLVFAGRDFVYALDSLVSLNALGELFKCLRV